MATVLHSIPQTPRQGASWHGGPFATSPAAAHALLHPGRQESTSSVVDYMMAFRGRNNPYYAMQRYWPAGADQAQALQGVGASPDEGLLGALGAIILGVIVVDLALSGVAGYQAGKAIAPNENDYMPYAAAGAICGAIGGVKGVAAVAAVALYNERK